MERDTTQKKYLKLYKEWMKTAEIPAEGLCIVFASDDAARRMVKLFAPEGDDFINYKSEIHNTSNGCYWGSGDRYAQKGRFTPLRQTIVLFMAAMNNEL